jgi:hypothetical protein
MSQSGSSRLRAAICTPIADSWLCVRGDFDYVLRRGAIVPAPSGGTEMRHLLTVAALLWSTIAFAADPVGTYTIEGTNPGNGSKYSGTVTVEKTGETFRVVWNVGGSRYVGTGLGDKNFIAVSYSSGSDTGLALYGEDGGNWKGVWTYAGSRNMGTELWKRQ